MQDLPPWLTLRAPVGDALFRIKERYKDLSLYTVCEEAHCPNAGTCFEKHTATFMILGNICTRNCSFCAVTHGKPSVIDQEEPRNIAKMALLLNLRHVVITSVTRDDLPDGGAEQFVSTVIALREKIKTVTIEVLIPDFAGSPQALMKVVEVSPEVINHNIETVPRLYAEVRSGAKYLRSLELLRRVKEKNPAIVTKSGLMVGLGEEFNEVMQVMKDLRAAGVELLTIGQYLAPSAKHYPVREFAPLETFERYRTKGLELGFSDVSSAPLVRSSFNAAKGFATIKKGIGHTKE